MEIFGVLASLLGIAAEASAQNDQKQLGWANLYETKRTNRKKEKLATSSREDAYGNLIYYDDAGKQWKIKSTPITRAILGAEQKENLASLTEDAPRNRAANIRLDERSKMGDEEFERAFNDFKYRPRKTEAEYVADATDEKLRARRKGADETAAMVNKSLLRSGNTSNIASVFREARDAEAEDFESALVGGKRQGQQDFFAHEGAIDQQGMEEINFLRAIADDTSPMGVRFTNTNQELSGDRDQALNLLLNTIAQNENSRQGATQSLMQVLGNSPNFSPLASSMSRLGSSFSGKAGAKTGAGGAGVSYSPGDEDYVYPLPYEDGVRARLKAGF